MERKYSVQTSFIVTIRKDWYKGYSRRCSEDRYHHSTPDEFLIPNIAPLPFHTLEGTLPVYPFIGSPKDRYVDRRPEKAIL